MSKQGYCWSLVKQALIHKNSSWNRHCFENKREKYQSSTCQQIVYSNVLNLWIYTNLVVPAVHLAVFHVKLRKWRNISKKCQKLMIKKAKTVKSVCNPKEASCKCLNRPEQESSAQNGKLDLCDYEIPRVTHQRGECCQNFVSNTEYLNFCYS